MNISTTTSTNSRFASIDGGLATAASFSSDWSSKPWPLIPFRINNLSSTSRAVGVAPTSGRGDLSQMDRQNRKYWGSNAVSGDASPVECRQTFTTVVGQFGICAMGSCVSQFKIPEADRSSITSAWPTTRASPPGEKLSWMIAASIYNLDCHVPNHL